jgi:hypothetical protein
VEGRAPRRQARAAQPLTRAQLGEHQVRLPIDAIVRHGDAQIATQAAEDACVDHHRDRHDALVEAIGVARLDLREGRCGGGALVRAPKAPQRIAPLRLFAEERVHRAKVTALPGCREVAGGPLRRAVRVRSDDHACDERHDGEAAQGGQRAVSKAPSALGGQALHGGRGCARVAVGAAPDGTREQ